LCSKMMLSFVNRHGQTGRNFTENLFQVAASGTLAPGLRLEAELKLPP